MNDNIMTSQQAADKVGVTVYTIYNWIKAGLLPASKIGKLFFIREADIQRLLNTKQIPSTKTGNAEGRMIIAMTGENGFIGKIIKAELESVGHVVQGFRTDGDYFALWETPYDCIIHCARDAKNLEEPITGEKWMNEYKTDVVLPYFFTMNMVKEVPSISNIIFITSIYGLRVPSVRYIPMNYNVAKAAERYLAENLAVTLAPSIRVNTIVLGGVHSDRELANQSDDFREKYHAHTLLNRMVQPDEIGGAIRFLVSDESKGMTGATIKIDGGYTLI